MKIRNSFLLLLASFVWGISFVSQRTGGVLMGSFTFNGIRSFIGSLFLLGLYYVLRALRGRKGGGETVVRDESQAVRERRNLILGGIVCGVVLFVATSLQQVGLTMGTGSGKAGFLTACYIVLVPIWSIFLGKRCGWNVWVAVFMAVEGLYLLCMKGSFSMQTSDLLVLLCALCFSVHILVIDHFSPLVDGVKLSCVQFLVCGILSLPFIFFVDMQGSFASVPQWLTRFGSMDAWIALLYAGIMSCGVGYTLQIVGQEGINPTVASLLMSPESVFSVLAGFVLLQETLTGREILGCVIMFAAIILSQIPCKPLRGRWLRAQKGTA